LAPFLLDKEMDKKTGATLRAKPQQARAQQRMSEILDAAAAVFAEVGYDAATTNEIAKRADTSIGSLYRFFPDKFAIFQALSTRYLQEASRLISIPGFLEAQMEEVVARAIDEFEKFRAKEPAFDAVFVFADASPELKSTDHHMKQTVAILIAETLSKRKVPIPSEKKQLVALVCLECLNSYMRLSLMQPKNKRPALKEECKRLVTSYLKSFSDDR
jgi:AcrR family transcriptional regulator